jgi:nitrate reductase gamma subunit
MAAGFWGMIRLWLLGKESTLNVGIKPSDWFVSFIVAIFLQPQILAYGFLPWLAHMMIFWGFISLLILTSFHFFLKWFIDKSSSLFQFLNSGSGNKWMALWGDFWGMVLLIGIVISLYRRYVLRSEYRTTITDDAIAIWFLFALTVSGFICEAVRILVNPLDSDAAYSFAVYWAVPHLIKMGFTQIHLNLVFWIHSAFSFIFIIYFPFSKFKHIFASPLDYAFVTSSQRYTR